MDMCRSIDVCYRRVTRVGRVLAGLNVSREIVSPRIVAQLEDFRRVFSLTLTCAIMTTRQWRACGRTIVVWRT